MLDIVGQIMSWIIIFVEVVSAVILFDSILPKRNISYNKTILYIAQIIVLTILTNILANNNINDWIDFIKFPLMYLLITSIFYKASFILRLGFSVIFYTTLIGIDYFIFLMLNSHLPMPNKVVFENDMNPITWTKVMGWFYV